MFKLLAFDGSSDEPRDEHGRFAGGGASKVKSDDPFTRVRALKPRPPAGNPFPKSYSQHAKWEQAHEPEPKTSEKAEALGLKDQQALSFVMPATVGIRTRKAVRIKYPELNYAEEAKMPWTAENAKEKTKKANTPDKQRKWAKIANAARSSYMKNGDTDEAASGKAIATANAAMDSRFWDGGTFFQRDFLARNRPAYWETDGKWTAEARAEAEKNAHAMSGGQYPIEDESDLKDAIRSISRAGNRKAAISFIKSRARAIGKSDVIPEQWGDARPLPNAAGQDHEHACGDCDGTGFVRGDDCVACDGAGFTRDGRRHDSR